VANAPENQAARQALIDAGKNLASTIAGLDAQLATVADDANAEFAALIAPGGEVDARAKEIANLNKAIVGAYDTGTTPNDLLDRRDKLVDELSELGRTTVTAIAPQGALQIDFGGQPLVIGAVQAPLPTAYAGPGGRLGALQTIGGPGGTVGQYRADLEAFAQDLRSAVNTAHPGFFDPATAPAASTLTVAVTAATLQPGAGAAPGDNSRALEAVKLRGGSPDALYAKLVTRIGGDLRNARREESNAGVLSQAVEDRRQSVMGVSMDEEMSNLIRFQRGYQASARALSTMDETLDVLINRTGRVGL
jgi:flagellar hook-associated protein 1